MTIHYKRKRQNCLTKKEFNWDTTWRVTALWKLEREPRLLCEAKRLLCVGNKLPCRGKIWSWEANWLPLEFEGLPLELLIDPRLLLELRPNPQRLSWTSLQEESIMIAIHIRVSKTQTAVFLWSIHQKPSHASSLIPVEVRLVTRALPTRAAFPWLRPVHDHQPIRCSLYSRTSQDWGPACMITNISSPSLLLSLIWKFWHKRSRIWNNCCWNNVLPLAVLVQFSSLGPMHDQCSGLWNTVGAHTIVGLLDGQKLIRLFPWKLFPTKTKCSMPHLQGPSYYCSLCT